MVVRWAGAMGMWPAWVRTVSDLAAWSGRDLDVHHAVCPWCARVEEVRGKGVIVVHVAPDALRCAGSGKIDPRRTSAGFAGYRMACLGGTE